MSRLYQFNLPTHTNAGRSYEHARKSWAAQALALAGGYTALPFARGLYASETQTYDETIAAYQVACDPAVATELLADAFLFFPDQEAFAVFDLGEASIINRKAWEEGQSLGAAQ